ncbi:helicase HerA-like domain-containing protein [Chryseobacterium sp. JAH]|uniref:helicase HerA-like domain-containing protein n=1 Tax=Chryseobacterium sp. JAH TaxID=1742858 RepID=UPI0007413EA3|nr:helicase HerA-like domain-containing protein [Chryseobacterium sp. JAH]KUJ51918.1 ATPase [Chryseobacterium sp. JAH]
MADKAKFIDELSTRYTPKGECIILGKGMLDGDVVTDVNVTIPLKTINRHGLIAGATGTGKTKTLQVFAEQLSHAGIPSLVLDIKGDFSGIAESGQMNSIIEERYAKTQLPYNPQAFPVELMSISGDKGVKLRATVTEFGPVLLSKILELNDTQQSIMSIVFKYCDDKGLPLIDLNDLKKVLQYVTDNPLSKTDLSANYGSIASASLGTILRSIVALEQQGAADFFGELSFDVQDLLETRDGKGVVNILRVADIQNKPQLFSTFMLSLFAEIYMTFPEEGDSGKPKLVLFIDEAHLIFDESSKALVSQIETMVKLIRSKGVGIYFITQIPGDVPENVLSQLGLKIQHALRGFTAKDKKEISKAVENYPTTEFYNASELIQNLGIGEAFVTALDEKGIPTPLVHTYLISPESRMDILSDAEVSDLTSKSALVSKYEKPVDSESAYEILVKRMEQAVENSGPAQQTKPVKEEPGMFEQVLKSRAGRTFANTLMREGAKAILGMFGLGGRKR